MTANGLSGVEQVYWAIASSGLIDGDSGLTPNTIEGRTGMSRGGVRYPLNRLVELGVVTATQGQRPVGKKGKLPTFYRLAPSQPSLIGIELSKTEYCIVLCDANRTIVDALTHTFTEDQQELNSPVELAERLWTETTELCERHSIKPAAQSLGIATFTGDLEAPPEWDLERFMTRLHHYSPNAVHLQSTHAAAEYLAGRLGISHFDDNASSLAVMTIEERGIGATPVINGMPLPVEVGLITADLFKHTTDSEVLPEHERLAPGASVHDPMHFVLKHCIGPEWDELKTKSAATKQAIAELWKTGTEHEKATIDNGLNAIAARLIRATEFLAHLYRTTTVVLAGSLDPELLERIIAHYRAMKPVVNMTVAPDHAAPHAQALRAALVAFDAGSYIDQLAAD